jgi:hypothetical protein
MNNMQIKNKYENIAENKKSVSGCNKLHDPPPRYPNIRIDVILERTWSR